MKMMTRIRALLAVLAIAFWFNAAITSIANAVDIQEIETASGIKAWLVEDYTVPIISTSFEFVGGASQDPKGKEGLGSVLAAMMDEGAGDLDTASLKAELEAVGIELGFSASQDSTGGGMRILASERDRAFELLRTIFLAPRFEAASLERIRASYLESVKSAQKRPESILRMTMRKSLFGEHPYGRSTRGTVAGLGAITREDVIAHHKVMFARSNMVLGVVGAINAEDLAVLLEKTFGDLPARSRFKPINEVQPQFGLRKHLSFESPQTIVAMAMPGLKRSDPQFFDAYLLNHILGGGTFSSRLYDEIREKRGLAYGVGSNLTTMDHSAYLGAGFATKPEQVDEALKTMLTELQKMAEHGPTEAELETAKKYLIGAYAISNLDTSVKIAEVLVSLQTSNLGIDYIDSRTDKINAVSIKDAREMARRLLAHEPTIITIGPGDV